MDVKCYCKETFSDNETILTKIKLNVNFKKRHAKFIRILRYGNGMILMSSCNNFVRIEVSTIKYTSKVLFIFFLSGVLNNLHKCTH